jgi:2-dehydro-3-deoxy-D-arabinonate dehydratase
MKLIHTAAAVIIEHAGRFFPLADDWDTLINHSNLVTYLRDLVARSPSTPASADSRILPPIGTQEVWAAGVTYFRSRTARMEESQEAGGGSFYDKVYQADRPELFFKSSPWRVRGSGETVRIRRDSRWSVPEPELALVVNSRAQIVGYTIANDMSSRDIEGENPLYLPQAKIYDGSCALGPGMLVREEALTPETAIVITITRAGNEAFAGQTTLAQMRRSHEELVGFLYREASFPTGCVLLTGTGVIPPDAFTLQSGDEITITIEPIGTLRNTVE